jgi:hypothetical protein
MLKPTPLQKPELPPQARPASSDVQSRKAPMRQYRRTVGILVAGKFILGETFQLSETGILAGLPLKIGNLEIGQKVVVSFFLPKEGAISIQCEITQNDKNQFEDPSKKEIILYGFKFIELPLSQRREIRNYVSQKTEGETSNWASLTGAQNQILKPNMSRQW